MRTAHSRRSAALSMATAMMFCGAGSMAQAANLLANPGFESPPGAGSVDTTIAGWTVLGDAARANFQNHTAGGARSVWFKTFLPDGGGVQQDVGITGGANYAFSGFNYFETSYPNTSATITMSVTWLDASNTPVGTPATVTILPTAVTTVGAWVPFSLNTTAPATATTARVFGGWDGGGTVTGAQSAFLDDVIFDGPGTPPPPIANDWVPNSSGDWNVASNWLSGTVPNAVGTDANFVSSITAPHTVYSDTAVTAGTLKFNNANQYVIAGAGSLTLDVATGNASINVLQGSHKINLPLRLNDTTIATVAAGATLTIADPLTLANGSTLTKAGAGTMEIISTVTTVGGAATLMTSAGTTNLRTDVGTTTTLQSTGGSTNVFASQSVPAVQVNGGSVKIDAAGSPRVIKTAALSFASTASGVLDVTDNGLIVTYSGASPLASVETAIKRGFNGGNWAGTGITTSLGDSAHGVGYAESSAVGSPTAFLGSGFAGSAVLVRYTLKGDTNLSGTVDFPDLLSLAQSYGLSGKAWINGDSNYDGTVNFADLLSLAQNYNQSVLSDSQVALVGSAFAADFALAQSLVPEPTTLAAIGLGVTLLRRRRA